MAAKVDLLINADARTEKAKAKLNDLKKDGINVADEIKAKNNEAIKGLIGMMSPVMLLIMALAAMAKGLKMIYDRGKALRDTAKDIGISADTLGSLQAAAKSAGKPIDELNKALAKMKDGKATLEEVQQEFGKIGDKSKYAAEQMKNYVGLATSKAFDTLGGKLKAVGNFFAMGTIKALSVNHSARMQMVAQPAIQAAVASGMSRDEAIAAADKEYRTRLGVRWTSQNADDMAAFGAMYDAEKMRQLKEQTASENRVMANLVESVSGDLEAAWKGYKASYGNISFDDFKTRAELGKTAKGRFETAEEQAKYESEQRKEAEKAEQERLKKEADIAKQQLAMSYVKGGGMLAGLNYGAVDQADAAKRDEEKLKEAKATTKGIKSLNKEVAAMRKGMLGE